MGPLPLAQLIRRSGNTDAAQPDLVSSQFDDVYFSDIGGWEETQHVFLDGNDLPQRFATLGESHFAIGELGFGTGLNIMAAIELWQRVAPPNAHLHLWSVEGYPLSTEDFGKSADAISAKWPDLAPAASLLKEAYPPLSRGFHQLSLTSSITLTLVLDDVAPALASTDGAIDAWFLDGFSPAKNPDMWRAEIMVDIGRLSAPNASIATFTVARLVRDGLESAGFNLAKRKGFGRKREMLTGQKTAQNVAPQIQQKSRRYHIKGGGIAGASLAWHLRRAGCDITLEDDLGLATGASGNPAGLIMPRFDLDTSPAADFYRQSYFYCLDILNAIEAVEKQIFNPCGALKLSVDAKASARVEKLEKSGLIPESHFRSVTTREAEHIAGVKIDLPPEAQHQFFPQGGIVDPIAYVKELAQGIPLSSDQPAGATIIHANSLGAANLFEPPALFPNLGQVALVSQSPPPKSALSFGPYIGPAPGHITPQDAAIIGATYDRETPLQRSPLPEDHRTQEVIRKLANILPEIKISQSEQAPARAAFRCVTKDKNPVMGLLETEDPILTGLGSRGLVTAPLLAAMLAAKLKQTPILPAPRASYDLVSPKRLSP